MGIKPISESNHKTEKCFRSCPLTKNVALFLLDHDALKSTMQIRSDGRHDQGRQISRGTQLFAAYRKLVNVYLDFLREYSCHFFNT